MPRIVIFANGSLPNLEAARAMLRADDFIIAADGGANHIMHMDVRPHLLIGDLDSIEDVMLQKYKSAGVEIEQYPVDKDETDLELALVRALKLNVDSILIIGALGGRLDQTLANLSLLTDERLAARQVRLDDGVEAVYVCRKQVEVQGRRGDVISLIPWGDAVTGVATDGLLWMLSHETLYSNKSRGISNVMTGESASITVESGLLLVIHTRKS